jgi:hypothetical protein
MANPRVRGITAYIGKFSTWTHTFSTVLSTEFHLSDVDFANPVTVTTCAGTGVDSRTPADSAPSSPETLLDAVDAALRKNSPRSDLLASILGDKTVVVQ